jgi:hypothetical protein
LRREREMFGLFSQTMNNDLGDCGNITLEDIDKTAEAFRLLNQKVRWREDREACLKDDRENNRGTLLVNPEIEAAEHMEGSVIEKDGVEYRVIVDDAMRGMRDKDGGVRFGYYAKPLPPISLAQLPFELAKPSPFAMSIRYGTVSPITGIGITPIDCSPPAILYVKSAKALKRIWRANRHMYQGSVSLKVYARFSEAGRAWLARKGQR